MKAERSGLRVWLDGWRLVRLPRKANFDPAQPRLPAGRTGGGRWANGNAGAGRPSEHPTGGPIRMAQARGGRGRAGPTLRLPGGVAELSTAQAARYDSARIRAEIEVARLRTVPGNENWKPPTGLYETVEGAIRHQQAIGDAALAYRYGRIGHNSGTVEPLRSGDTQPFAPGTLKTLAPNGVPLGSRLGSAGPNIFTLDREAFDRALTDLLRGSRPVRTPESYIDRGYWIELADRCIVGIRWSKDNGLTMEIMRLPHTSSDNTKFKFHRSER